MKSSSRWVHSWWLVLPVVLLAGLFLYVTRDNGLHAVRLASVEKIALVSNLTTNGKVEPVDARELRALLPGTIASVAVKEGDHVRAGEIIMQLDRTEAAAEVARAEAEVQSARADLKNIEAGGSVAEHLELENDIQKATREQQEAARQLGIAERLLAKNAAPRSEVDAAKDRLSKANHDLTYLQSRRTKRFGPGDREKSQARVNEARATLDLAKTRLAATAVVSPLTGVVFALPVQRGNFANRGDLLAKVADLGKLRLKVFVDEPELGRLAAGQDVAVTWDAYPGAVWEGKVQRLPSEVILLGTRSVGQVECTIENSDYRLLPNVNVNVEIVAKRTEQALTLPKEAVVTEPGSAKHYVFAYSDNKVQRREVKVGISTATRWEIVQGVSEGDIVAIAIDRKLADGMRVKSDGAGTP